MNKDEILGRMTKDELIWFIKSHFFGCKIRWSAVLVRRWEVKSREMLNKQKAHTEALANCDWKKRDEYAKLFNASTCNVERLKLLDKMIPIDEKFNDWIVAGRKLDKEEKMVDQLYASIDATRKKENV